MATKGKKFEHVFSSNWAMTVPESFCYRLNDQMSGYLGSSSNVGDFITYKKPILFLIDCKTHAGNTLSLSNFSQYERMLEYKDIPGVVAGTVIWFYERDNCVVWVPITTWEKIVREGKKSFNVKLVEDPEYECFLLPSKKKRVYSDTDYSFLVDYYINKHLSGAVNGQSK